MTTVEAPVRLGISLQVDAHMWQNCTDLAEPLRQQMASGKYDVCATMPLPKTREAWEAEHRTARKRAWRAEHSSYIARQIDRGDWGIDIQTINQSRPYRQGRPMAASYSEPPTTEKDTIYPCDLHAIRTYGVLRWETSETESIYREVLYAYLTMYRAGDLALVSQVLGHADHEPNGVMYLLFRHALEVEGAIAPGVCVYNRWDSGTDGLRFLKARIGFEETAVEWLP